MNPIKGKKIIPMIIDESIYREIKVYAAETDKTIQEVVKPLTIEFEQAALRLATEIRQLKREAELERLKQTEDQKIADEHPMVVSGVPATNELEAIPLG